MIIEVVKVRNMIDCMYVLLIYTYTVSYIYGIITACIDFLIIWLVLCIFNIKKR